MVHNIFGGNITPRQDGFLGVKDEEKSKSWIPNHKETEILSYIRNFWKGHDGDTYKWNFEKEWYESVAMREGRQYVYWNHALRTLRQMESVPWRRQIVVNKILPGVERAVSSLGALDPEPSVAPAGPELRFRDAARVAVKLWRAFAQEAETTKKFKKARLNAVVTGNAVGKVTWNPMAGPVTMEYKGQKIHEGRPDFRIVSPWSIFLDPVAQDIETTSWLSEETIMPVPWVRARFPERGKYVVPDRSSTSIRAWRDRNLLTLSSRFGSHASLGGLKSRDVSVTVVEFWMRPNKTYPEGLHIIMANGVMLNPKNGYRNPYVGLCEDGFLEIPYVHFPYYDGVNRFWGTGWVANQTPIQREINNRTNLVAEHIQTTTHAPWILPKGHGISDEMLLPRPDARIEWSGIGPAPHRAEIPQLPAQVFQSKEDLKFDFDEAGAQSDATKGMAPGQVRTGIGIQALQARDQGVVKNPRDNYFDFLRGVGRAYLVLNQRFATEERTAKLLGPDGEWEVFNWKGVDLTGATELHLTVDASLGNNMIERRAIVQEWVQWGLLQPAMDPYDRKLVMRLMQSQSLDKALWHLTLSERQAERHISLMTRIGPDGSPPPRIQVQPYWDIATHHRIKNEFRFTPEYESLPDFMRANYDAHCHELAMMLAVQTMQENLQAESTRGGAAEKGTPSPPKPQPSGAQKQEANQAGGMESS